MIRKFQATLVKKEDLTNEVKHLTFKTESLSFEPGQFVSISIPGKKILKRDYSIASIPHPHEFNLCVKKIEGGPGSTYLHDLKVGKTIDCIGPMGGFQIKDDKKDIVFIATGTGISPFMSMIPHLLHEKKSKRNITLVVGFRSKQSALYIKELLNWEKEHGNFTVQMIYSSKGIYVQNALPALLQDVKPKKTHFYIAGLNDMITAVKNTLADLGMLDVHIFTEKYD